MPGRQTHRGRDESARQVRSTVAYADDDACHRSLPARARAACRRAPRRRERLRAARRAASPRAARPLLPDARLDPRRRRRRAGRDAPRLARPAALRGPQLDAQLAVHHHDERVPQRDRAPPEGARPAGRLRRSGRPARRRRRAARRVGVDRALPRRPPRPRGRLRGARRAVRRARERRACVRRRAAASAAQPARGPDHARGARLLGRRGRVDARHDRRVGQQRAAARAQDDRRQASGPLAAGDAARARRRAGAGSGRALRRRLGARRRRGRRRHAQRGGDVLDAAERRLVPRARGDRDVPADRSAQPPAPLPARAGERPARVRHLHLGAGARPFPAERDPPHRPRRRPHPRHHGVPGPGRVPRVRTARPAAGRVSDPTGWFEPLYRAAAAGEAVVPWDDGAPSPLLVEWTATRSLSGQRRRAVVVGCGLGDDAEHVASLGFRTVAFDVAPTAIAGARRRFPESAVEYVVADLLSLPPAWDEAFDLVIEHITVQALPESVRPAAIGAVSGLVAPGGTLLVISGARDVGEAVNGPPWPLTRGEVESFATGGLALVRVEELAAGPERPWARSWRAELGRPLTPPAA